MTTQAGNLHWRRARLTLGVGLVDVDTLLTTANKAYDQTGGPATPTEPPLGVIGIASPPPGSQPASRIQVIPLPPLAEWAFVTAIGEPWFDTADGHVHVDFVTNPPEGDPDITINVLFWNPHTINSPGQADTYNAPE